MQLKRFTMVRQLRVATLMLLHASLGLAAPVLMISVDGLKPEYVLEADAHGLKIPYLRRRTTEGAYALGVTGVWPTVTYPSHTTLVTGVTPAEHGILNNSEFDPLHEFKDSWFWYARQIQVPTLWDAAHAAGLGTASIGWPVTVGNTNIDYLIPEYWRISGTPANGNSSDRYLIGSLSRPEGLLAQMQAVDGAYMMGNDTSLQGDVIKTKFAVDIIRNHKPALTTVHLSSLDDAQHAHGVFSPQANQDLEAIDSLLAQLAAAAYASDPATIVTIVSDHGFANLTHRVNLNVLFRQSGLIEETRDPGTGLSKVTAWKAESWLAGGMAAIMLHEPEDQATAHVVYELLQKLAADPNNGIASIKSSGEIKNLGAFPGAAYLVVFKPGYYAGGNSTGDIVTDIEGTLGGHGFTPEFPEMRSSFFIAGPGIAHHRNLGVIDMRQIAPTLAQLMRITLPSAKAVPLNVRQ
jgi:predicted AlkP superfamily pyrophosphatase or phosphodiesterase